MIITNTNECSVTLSFVTESKH